MSDTNGYSPQADFLVEGFHILDDNIVELRAPKISTLPGYDKKSDSQKALYMQRLAATMNHAAKLIQDERDKLVALMEKKEEQLKSMAAQIEANNSMVQSEVARMNEQKQGFHAEVSRLTARIRELESGNID